MPVEKPMLPTDVRIPVIRHVLQQTCPARNVGQSGVQKAGKLPAGSAQNRHMASSVEPHRALYQHGVIGRDQRHASNEEPKDTLAAAALLTPDMPL